MKPSGNDKDGQPKGLPKGVTTESKTTRQVDEVVFAERSDFSFMSLLICCVSMHMTVHAWWRREGPSHSACKQHAWWQYVCMHAASLVLVYRNSSPPPKPCSSGSPPTIFSHRDLISHPRLQRKCRNWNSDQWQVTPSVSGRQTQRWQRCIHYIPHNWEKNIFSKKHPTFVFHHTVNLPCQLECFLNRLGLSNVYIW